MKEFTNTVMGVINNIIQTPGDITLRYILFDLMTEYTECKRMEVEDRHHTELDTILKGLRGLVSKNGHWEIVRHIRKRLGINGDFRIVGMDFPHLLWYPANTTKFIDLCILQDVPLPICTHVQHGNNPHATINQIHGGWYMVGNTSHWECDFCLETEQQLNMAQMFRVE